ncbi:MAG: transporter substrate-binding domain-containing protein [Syntrophorhabdaceae bacterium]|nr:transporter substrate-binding domain-containing protein [Syntrophorhabdaceae bacterium]
MVVSYHVPQNTFYLAKGYYMKRYLMLAVAAMCLLLSGIAQAETLIASGHPQYPPIMWKENNTIVGAGPELVRLLFKDLNVTVNSPFCGDWDKVQQEAKEGKVDLLVGLYMTEDRKAFFEYSNPYAKDPVVAFVARGKRFPYSKWDDLIGKKGTTTVGDSFGQVFDRFLSEKLTVTRSAKVEQNFSKLIKGRADYFVYAMYSGLFEADKLGITNKVEILPKEICVENWYIGISKKSPYVKYLPQINKKLDELIDNGTVDRLIEKYGSQYRRTIANKKKGSPTKVKR